MALGGAWKVASLGLCSSLCLRGREDACAAGLAHLGGEKKHDTNKLSPLESLVAGGVAGCIAKSIIAPGDRVRILYQVNPTRDFSFEKAMKTAVNICRHTGASGLWRGNAVAMMRVVPYSGVAYMTFEQYHNLLHRLTGRRKDHAVLNRFLAGAMAGATATTLTYPLDLLRARMAAHWGVNPKYSSYSAALREIAQQEGVLSLWGGLRPTLVGIIPYAGLSFMTFETAKAKILVHDKASDDEMATWKRLLAGAFAGLVAQSATYPLDIVRRRMQVGAFNGNYSVVSALRSIFANEGYRGLYKGLSMSWVKGPISVAVSFTVNDLLKRRIREHHRRQQSLGLQAQ